MNFKFINYLNHLAKSSVRSGQVVLILVLVTVVGLTIGLSLISRTVTDVRISSQIEQSSRAFSAAEAGVESALRLDVVSGPTGTVSVPGASATYSVNTIGGTASVLTFPLTDTGISQTVWLIPHNNDGTLNEGGTAYPPNQKIDVCWGSVSGSVPAILVSYFYKEVSTYKMAKGAYDPNSTRGNNFSNVTDTVGGYCSGNYHYRKTITPTTEFGIPSTVIPIMIRLQPVYAHTALAVSPYAPNTLPVQGTKITSEGQTSTGVVRRIQVSQGYKIMPSLLDFGLFSEN